MKNKIYILPAILLSLVLTGAVQADSPGSFKDAADGYNSEYPSEKIYIQTDRTYYRPTETVWYKGFLADATDNRPSSTSDVVYVELRDPWGTVTESHEHNVVSGTFNGSFEIQADRPGGIYTIAAYTNWMKNWGEDSFFTKEITVHKVVTPRLLLRLDFVKRAYGPGDEVVATLKVTDLDNVKTTGSVAVSTVRLAGREIATFEDMTADGEATIRFTLPADLDTSDGILQVVVTDKGLEESVTRSIPIVLDRITIQFFPEGGDMAVGVRNKVAFEALNEFGKGADVSGEIVDGSGQVVTTFSSFHLGMGAFEFTPQADTHYFARITVPAGNEDLRELPPAVKGGYVLSLSGNDGQTLTWRIVCPAGTAQMTLVGHTRGVVHYMGRQNLVPGGNEVKVDVRDFPAGIAVFTLFDGSRPVAERLVMLNRDRRLHIKLETDKDTYEPLEEVKLSVITTDEHGMPVAANIGLAVVDEQILTMADDKQDNLLTYLFLSSELKGAVQEPSFYFDPQEPKAAQAMEYLLLTHGWRRFNWVDVLDGKSPFKVTNMAEKHGSVYGYVLGPDGRPVKAEVYLIEMEGRRRIARLDTTEEGHFVFHNIDISGAVYVTTKLPNTLTLIDGIPVLAKGPGHDGDDQGVMYVDDAAALPAGENSGEGEGFLIHSDILSFEAARNQLDEVVVVGYGVSAMRTAGLVSISRSRERIQTADDIAWGLSGSVAGLSVRSPGVGDSPASSRMVIRGANSLIDSEPLIVIDGIPVSAPMARALDMVNPADIGSIEVLKSSSASSVYGSRAANGVMLITTRSARFKRTSHMQKPRYSGSFLPKKQFYSTPQFSQARHNPDSDSPTVFWDGSLITGRDGKAEVKFRNNRPSSTFRITAEGISPSSGLPGSHSRHIVVSEDFSIDAKIPAFAGCGDVMKIPILLRNNTDKATAVALTVAVSRPGLPEELESKTTQVEVPANTVRTVYTPVAAGTRAGNAGITIVAEYGKHSQQLKRSLTIRQVNFHYHFSLSGRQLNNATGFFLPDYVPGTLDARVKIYPDVIEELFDGAKNIFSEPHGCFEQLLSSAFPNVFALQLLQATGKDDPEVSGRALKYLRSGYQRLANYEVRRTGGFEWYGGSPAHEMLTAYGLVHFHELSRVYDGVDKNMVERALSFLLSRRDGQGGFRQNNGRYGFSGAPENVNNAYIVYAFHEFDQGGLVDAEYRAVLEEALRTGDPYRMALVANAAYARGDSESYGKLIARFRDMVGEGDGFDSLKIESTIVRSYGKGQIIEATGYWLLALLKDSSMQNHDLAKVCLEYISKNRAYGGFGTTQATSVCLQALTRYALGFSTVNAEGVFSLDVNGERENRNILSTDGMVNTDTEIDFTDRLRPGNNDISLGYSGMESGLPYCVDIKWSSATPASSDLCPLELTADINSTGLRVNETVRLSVRLRNKEDAPQPMSLAIIGIPGGMSLQPWQLKELQEKEVVDFYEITDDNLVIYYRELGPSEEKLIELDLKAEIPGNYTGMASSAYVYYMNEHKHWIDGISVDISE